MIYTCHWFPIFICPVPLQSEMKTSEAICNCGVAVFVGPLSAYGQLLEPGGVMAAVAPLKIPLKYQCQAHRACYCPHYHHHHHQSKTGGQGPSLMFRAAIH